MDWSVDSNYLPNEYRNALLRRYDLDPQTKIDYLRGERFKFKPKDRIDFFQDFLNAQQLVNPESLFADKLPKTPFGSFASYLDAS